MRRVDEAVCVLVMSVLCVEMRREGSAKGSTWSGRGRCPAIDREEGGSRSGPCWLTLSSGVAVLKTLLSSKGHRAEWNKAGAERVIGRAKRLLIGRVRTGCRGSPSITGL